MWSFHIRWLTAVVIATAATTFCIFWVATSSSSPIPAAPSPEIAAAPFADLKATNLHDSFNEIHHGHRHEAIDIMEPRGTPIHAVVDGTIRKLFTSRAGGTTIYEFDTTGSYCYYYAHLDRYADGLRENMAVKHGQILGYVGTSGNASPDAPQLHLAIIRLGPDRKWWQGSAIDPYPVLLSFVQKSSNQG